MALDQTHEQLNDVLKGDRGAVGLTEIARLVNEFDEHNGNHDGKHHEQSTAVQAELRKDVGELTGIVRRMGNPFFFTTVKILVTLNIKLSSSDPENSRNNWPSAM